MNLRLGFGLFRRADTQHAGPAVAPARPAFNGRLTVYGTGWCGDCHRARRFLEKNRVPYRWIDIDRDADAAQKVRALNQGRRSVPTVVFPDGSILTEPANVELEQKLGLR